MPWLAFTNRLRLRLADTLQSLAVWLTPEVHAPGPQEDNHPHGEDASRTQSIRRYKVTHPPDWPPRVAESSGGDSSTLIGNEVERECSPLVTKRADVEVSARADARLKTEPAPAAEPDTQSRSSQELGLHQSGLKPAAMHSTGQIFQYQEPQASTAIPDAATRNTRESAEDPGTPKQQSWIFQAARKIASRFRPAIESSVVLQACSAKAASINDAEPAPVFNEVNADTTSEQQSQPESTAASEQERQEPLSRRRSKNRKAVVAELPRLTRHRQSPEQDEIVAKRDGADAPRTAPQTSLRPQRETAPVLPWPTPAARVAVECERWPIPGPVFLGRRERNLTAAASSSWQQSPAQEIAPGLPLLPQEFRPSPENSGNSAALYPWPELPQIVEEDPDEPRKLLQNHERQMRVLREQRGAW